MLLCNLVTAKANNNNNFTYINKMDSYFMFPNNIVFSSLIILFVLFNAGCSSSSNNPPAPTDEVIVSVADSSILEGDAGTIDLSFTISLNTSSSVEARVDYELTNGTATINEDYTVSQSVGTVVFAPGTTIKTVNIQVIGDTSVEQNETIFLSLTNPSSNMTLGDVLATGTISNDDIDSGGLPLVSIGNSQIAEGDAGSTQLEFIVTLDSVLATDVSMFYSVGNSGDATAGVDFAGTGITPITIAAGNTTATISVTIFGDTLFETNETFAVSLSNISDNAFLNNSTGTGTILNDDTAPVNTGLPVVNIDNAQVLEGNSGLTSMTFDVHLSEPSDSVVSLFINVSAGSARRTSDYEDNTDTFVSFPVGSTLATITLDIVGDTTVEPDETFSVSLNLFTANVTAGDLTATGTILNDDLPLLDISGPSISEGDSGVKFLNFSASLPVLLTQDVLFTYNISAGTATENVDFTPVANTTIAIPAGTQSVTLPVEILGDLDIEPNETVVLTLSSVSNSVAVASNTFSATILDDDLPILSTTGQRVVEGDSGTQDLTFTVNLSRVSTTDVTVNYEVDDVRATLNEDFTITNPTGVLTIVQGELSASVTITVLGDTKIEQDELIWFFVTNVSGVAAFPNATTRIVASGYIDNDDFPTVSITDATLTEGDFDTKQLLFSLSLDGPSSGSRTLAYTLTGTASAGEDYVLPDSKEVTFPFGEVVTTIPVTINGDYVFEPDETIIISIQSLANSDIIVPANTQATGTIVNDDPKINVADATVMEGNTGTSDLQFVISLSNTMGTDVTFNYEITGLTAQVAIDFSDAQLVGSGVITAGTQQTIVNVPVIGDNVIEPRESLQLTITSASGNVFSGDLVGKGRIINDDGGTTINLAETGQQRCYSEEGVQLSSCQLTGQDGDTRAGITWSDPRFVTNVDGTISDTLTGLAWGNDANLMVSKDAGWDTDDIDDGKVTWQHALDYVAKLNADNYLGFNDWRLPNRNEIRSLVNYGASSPASWLNSAEQGFSNFRIGFYWSSTSLATFPVAAWSTSFADGWVVAKTKDTGQAIDHSYLLPVRGGQNIAPAMLAKTGQTSCYNEAGTSIDCNGTGQDGETQSGVSWPATRFNNNGDGSITDTLSQLMWVTNTNLIKSRNPELLASVNDGGDISWSAGLDYVKFLNNESYLGYNDWRLPNVVELQSLLNAQQENESWLSNQGFSNIGNSLSILDNYWSSTSYLAISVGNAWGINLLTGDTPSLNKTSRDSFVWPVRELD